MKYKKYIIMPMLLALLSVATSCEQEELPPVVTEGDVVEVTATIGDAPDTRVSQPEDNIYKFEANDRIHIVGWTGDWEDYNKPWEDAADTWWNDAVSTYNGYKWKTEPYMCWQNGDGLQHHFLAWWPENFVKSDQNLTDIDITLTGDYNKDDILVAKWNGTRPDDNTLKLEFEHLLSRFDVHLIFRSEYTEVSNISIETNLRNQAVCDFLAGTVSSPSGEGIMMQKSPTPDESYDWSGTCITVPHEFYGDLLTLNFTTPDGDKTITYEHPNDLIFKSGERTTLYLYVGKDVVVLGGVKVTPWNTKNNGDLEAE